MMDDKALEIVRQYTCIFQRAWLNKSWPGDFAFLC